LKPQQRDLTPVLRRPVEPAEQKRTTDNKTRSSDLPVGRFVDRAVQPPLQKYFASVVGRNISMSPAIPSHTEGRFAIVTDVGHGMRWTRQRLARDGIAGLVERLVSDHRHADERCCCVRQNRVVLTPRRWRQVLRSLSRPNRALDKTISARRRWQKSPVTGESTT
jgi:hypothetical protein